MNSDLFESFSLLKFAIVAAIYTFLAFIAGRRRGAMVFSSSNIVPTSTILTEHIKFLTILLLVMVTLTWVYPHLPEWTKEAALVSRSGRGTASGVDFGFLILALGLLVGERRRTYVEGETESEASQ